MLVGRWAKKEEVMDPRMLLLDGGGKEDDQEDFTGADDDHAADDQQGGGEGGEKTVPLSALEAVREELKDTKGQVASLTDQVRLYQANTPQTGKATDQGGEAQGGGESEALAGLEDDEVITVADAKKLISGLEAKVGSALGEVTTAVQYPDYQDVIANHLPNVLKSNPALVQALRASPQRALLAYELGKTDPEYIKKKAEADQTATQKKIDENLEKPGSVSQAGGGGGGISAADSYAQMSDDDLEKKIDDVKKRG